ncbi:MAG: hydrolase, partial [Rhizorhabdus sp.]|nr:hydrolase [Rhizorhabdus sp.]
GSAMVEIKQAATLILLRDAKDGPPDILMVERGRHLAFAAGNMVFPGGRVDADDGDIAADHDLIRPGPAIEAADLAARIAAIRETIEEVGLAPAIEGSIDPDVTAQIRDALAEGRLFSDLLRQFGLRIDPYRLYPFARWLPDGAPKRAFDTRFYVAQAPDQGEAVADGHESASCHWATAAGHLARADARSHPIIFPTRRNLERVAQVASFEAAVAFVGRYAIDTVSPWAEDRDGVPWLRIPDHLGYPVTGEPMANVERG